MKKALLLFSLLLALVSAATAQHTKNPFKPIATAPKLVVGLVVDQMRYDYLTRFWHHYGKGGFKRLVKDGFTCKNHHFNYAPTSTAPGHASIYTGTTPATHGIIGNTWYDKITGQEVYCVADDDYTSVGTATAAGAMSPHRMLTTTITDQLRLHTQKRGKVIAIALKDRGAVLPGGFMANAAYWFEGGTQGHWISSSYYKESLPQWVRNYNASDAVAAYKKPWRTLKPIATYRESGADANTYEGLWQGKTTTAFPHNLPALWEANGQFSLLRNTPYGNSITTEFALAALEGEQLGTDAITDFLAISFSSTDYVGHMYGVNSKEIQDTYLRLDRDLERLLTALDRKVGVGAYTVFLTADHGAIHVPAYLRDQNIAAGYLNRDAMEQQLSEFLTDRYGTSKVVKHFAEVQLFLNDTLMARLGIATDKAEAEIAQELLHYKAISRVYTAQQMRQNSYTQGIGYRVQQGYHPKRSGAVVFVARPGFIDYTTTGSSHGTPMVYDTHVPLLWYGQGIRPGHTARRTEVTDIAPTLAVLLGMAFPNGTTGEPIGEVLE